MTVSDGLLTIAAGAGALDPKINFIEIGAAGSAIDAATTARVAEAATQATKDTAKGKAKTPPTVKRNVWGDYVDSLVSYTIKKPRKAAVRYYAHANSLFSVAAVTSATGSVVERWSYNAYGVPTIKNSAGATLAKSGVGQTRGFTSYTLDSETGLYAARARMYSAKLGRFISRDPTGYVDGLNLFFAYFIPNEVDPSGLSTKWDDFNPDIEVGPPITDASCKQDCIKDCERSNRGMRRYKVVERMGRVGGAKVKIKLCQCECKKGGGTCSCDVRDQTKKCCPETCPSTVRGSGDDRPSCQDDARKNLPQECRAFLGHCKWFPSGCVILPRFHGPPDKRETAARLYPHDYHSPDILIRR